MTTRSLWTSTIILLLLGAVLSAVCYFFVDRPVALFFHNHVIDLHDLLVQAEQLSDWLKYATLVAIPLVVLWRLWKRGGHFQTVLLALSADWIVITVLKVLAKGVCGRSWPQTWDSNGPSWLDTGEYGFHPFHFDKPYAFPSGHAAVVFSVAAVLWFSYPRWRWCYALVCAAMCVALVVLNYHFVGDVVAGAAMGSITGLWVWRFFQRRD
jgi:membrane-associated phospholipid phosphatase